MRSHSRCSSASYFYLMTVRFAPTLSIFIAASFLSYEDPTALSSILLVTRMRVVSSTWLPRRLVRVGADAACRALREGMGLPGRGPSAHLASVDPAHFPKWLGFLALM